MADEAGAARAGVGAGAAVNLLELARWKGAWASWRERLAGTPHAALIPREAYASDQSARVVVVFVDGVAFGVDGFHANLRLVLETAAEVIPDRVRKGDPRAMRAWAAPGTEVSPIG